MVLGGGYGLFMVSLTSTASAAEEHADARDARHVRTTVSSVSVCLLTGQGKGHHEHQTEERGSSRDM